MVEAVGEQTTSSDIEKIILGSMMYSLKNTEIVADAVTADDFAIGKHAIIFNHIKKTQKDKGALDITLIAETLKSNEKLQEIGDYKYLVELSNFAGTSAHIEAYCDDLRKLTIKRSLLNVQRSIADDFEKHIDPITILERLGNKIEDIKANKPNADSLFRHFLDPVSEADIVKEIRNTSPGVSVGFKVGEIDLKLSGGAITIVAGPTGHGKTLLLINFILNYLELHPDKQVFFFSYEESRSAILSLFLNAYIGQDISKNNRESIKSYFRDGNTSYITVDTRSTFMAKKEEFFNRLIATKRLNICYSDYSADELMQAIKFLKKNTNVGLVGIDYIQLLSLRNKKTIPRQEELKQISLMLKDCADIRVSQYY